MTAIGPYDERVLTEDNELTLALRHLGYRIVSPRECTLTTEVMTSWRALARQRLRWKRGALENLVDYGLTRVTLEYWARQALSLIGVIVTATYLATIAWALLAGGGIHWHLIWMVVSAIFVLERVVSVRDRGWRQQILAAPLVIEMVFDVFLQAVQARAFAQAALRSERRW